MKITTMAQAAEAERATREFYCNKIKGAVRKSSNICALARTIGLDNGPIYQVVNSMGHCKLPTLRKYAEAIDEAGL